MSYQQQAEDPNQNVAVRLSWLQGARFVRLPAGSLLAAAGSGVLV